MSHKLKIFGDYLNQKLKYNNRMISIDKYNTISMNYYTTRVQLLNEIIHDYELLVKSKNKSND